MKKKKTTKPAKVCYIYDTETCNIIDPYNNRYDAYPILYIINDISGTSLRNYTPEQDDNIEMYRDGESVIDYIADAIEFGKDNTILPIMAIYNAMFDLLPLMDFITAKWKVKINAQSTTSIYTLDIMENDEPVLRFWDTSYLEPRGLKFMGDTAGLEKADGDWDYEKIRTPETPLTHEEIHYARRDVQVIPAYLRFLLTNNPHLDEEDLGTTLITKTSLVRLFGKRVVGRLEDSKGRTVSAHMFAECKRETPRGYETYATRKACFRGGLTFTSANYASETQHNIASLDVTSMHHAFINGRYVPAKFEPVDNPKNGTHILTKIKNTSLRDVLQSYHMPFAQCFNACIKIINMKVKPGSVFEAEGIAILTEAKCHKNAMLSQHEEEAKQEAEAETMGAGYKDRGLNVENCYGKIYSADEMYIYVNEIEWWNICQVYTFDSYEWISGEMTWKQNLPPDYVTLMSNRLYEMKDEMKGILKKMDRGEIVEHGGLLPDIIYQKANEGTDSARRYLQQYYEVIVKGQFNAIYGMQAQDVNKPGYSVDERGELEIDDSTRKTRENFENSKQGMINYVYGSRIVAGSRMHLIIAMILEKRAHGDKIRIIGGDTDSLKIATDEDVTNEDLLKALEPLHTATTKAIDRCNSRIRANYPEHASKLTGIGLFEIEHGGERYRSGREYWNKCRAMITQGGKMEITCAGISRPEGYYTLEDIGNRMLEIGMEEDEVYDIILGYNTTYLASVSHLLEHKKPRAAEMINEKIKDYAGTECEVHSHKSICLYPAAKTIGDDIIETNYKNIVYKLSQGKQIKTDPTVIWQDDDHIYVEINYTLQYKIPKR